MLVLIGASASGKTEIAKIIIHRYGFQKLVTCTTRERRAGELDGVDYHFLTVGDFLRRRAEGYFIETATYGGNYYGTPREEIRSDRVLIVDTKGANVLNAKLGRRLTIFFLEAPKSVRAQRMIARGDALDDIEHRLEVDDERFDPARLDRLDHLVRTRNKTLEELASEIHNLYRKHFPEGTR